MEIKRVNKVQSADVNRHLTSDDYSHRSYMQSPQTRVLMRDDVNRT